MSLVLESTVTSYSTHLGDGGALHIRIQFLQQLDRLFSAKLAQRVVIQEEVDTQIRLRNDGRIEDTELSDPG